MDALVKEIQSQPPLPLFSHAAPSCRICVLRPRLGASINTATSDVDILHVLDDFLHFPVQFSRLLQGLATTCCALVQSSIEYVPFRIRVFGRSGISASPSLTVFFIYTISPRSNLTTNNNVPTSDNDAALWLAPIATSLTAL